MFSSVKLSINQSIYKIAKEVRRHFNKNSGNVILGHPVHKFRTNLVFNESNRNFSKWNNLTRYSNIRALSTNQSNIESTIDTTYFVSKEESQKYMALFPEIVRDLTELDKYKDISDITKRLAKVLQYNVFSGKKIGGLNTIVAYKILEKQEKLTPENIKLSYILAWCAEIFMTYVIILDDLLDNSETRRGIPCWYRKPEVGLQAVNDAIAICSGLYQILKKYFSSLPCYLPIVELFNDCTFKTALGQSFDTLCMENNKPKLDEFTMNRYMTIVKYKTSYFAFHLPVTSAMYLANIFDEELLCQFETILISIGQLFQIQDDFLDCFGKTEVMEKIGTDIIDGKCSWLAVVALQRATPTQRAVMEEHYGRVEAKSAQAIRTLYEELSLPSIYAKYEEESYNLICAQIQQLPKEEHRKSMFKIMEQIYKRKC